ncbi:longitudinals lacking protein, isoforms A/B/D/L isoform X4 [Hermetia illucens]|uniref:longitudinals lacking protein, isoforms A/B/D/L isoform X4 n=1 Tax=Hermetia illucens TaxID=343691 RepID=UPI0018CC23BF|nr:longitudinals lacking protein, isoforms A/B/D/L isoform X4 [Hermetia illucens]
MDDDQQFCLRWNNHQSTLISVFDTLLENGTLVDCTLAAEGKFLKAHKVVLSACSPYFATLLSQQYDKHPIFILKDVKFQELRAMMDYMYRGEVNISQDQLAALLKAAESLQIKGLSDSRGGASSAVSGSAGICASQKSDHKALSVPVTSGPIKSNSPSGGYTIEQKRPRHAVGASSSIESQAGSREGSSSPTSRKRKRIRRRSMDNLTIDNHEHSNSSSQSMQINSSVAPSNTSTAMGSVPSSVAVSQAIVTQQTGAVAGTSGIVTAGTNTGLNVTKKTDSVSSNAKLEGAEQEVDNDNGDEEDESGKLANMRKEQNKRKQHTSDVDQKDSGGEILIEPKSEYDDGNDETVEDLTLDDEELLEDLEQAGPSHGGGEGSSQGYAQWQVERSQDDVFMATQESAGQQRDPQAEDLSITRIAGLTWDQWNARLAMPLVTQLREGVHPLIFPTDLSVSTLEKSAPTSISTAAGSSLSVTSRKSPPPSSLYSSPNGSNVATVSGNSGGGAACGGGGSGSGISPALRSNILGTNSGELQDTASGSLLSKSVRDIAGNLCSLGLLSSVGGGLSVLSNSNGSGHPCPDCGRVYKLKSSLRNHQKWECGKEPQFQCPFCVYRAKQKMHIGRHMERMHKEKFIKLEDVKMFTEDSSNVNSF